MSGLGYPVLELAQLFFQLYDILEAQKRFIEEAVFRFGFHILLEISNCYIFTKEYLSGVLFEPAGDDAEERRLSCSIRPYEAYFLTFVYCERNIIYNCFNAVRFGYIIN